MHLGLIGGIGPAATEFYYRGLVRAHAAAGTPLELTISNADSRVMLENLLSGQAQTQAEVFLEHVNRLQAAGADTAVVTSLGSHFCITELEAISPLPVFNAIPVLDRYFAGQDMARIALLGTRTVMESRLYGGVSSVEFVLPQGDALDAAHDNYVAMAMAGEATDEQKDFFLSLGRKLCEEGADAVALGGTDLFLAFGETDCGYRVIDCAQVHIDALASASIGQA